MKLFAAHTVVKNASFAIEKLWQITVRSRSLQIQQQKKNELRTLEVSSLREIHLFLGITLDLLKYFINYSISQLLNFKYSITVK